MNLVIIIEIQAVNQHADFFPHNKRIILQRAVGDKPDAADIQPCSSILPRKKISSTTPRSEA